MIKKGCCVIGYRTILNIRTLTLNNCPKLCIHVTCACNRNIWLLKHKNDSLCSKTLLSLNKAQLLKHFPIGPEYILTCLE